MSRFITIVSLAVVTAEKPDFFGEELFQEGQLLKNAAHSLIPTAVGEALAEIQSENALMKDGKDDDGKQDCKECVMKVTHGILERVYKAVDAKCGGQPELEVPEPAIVSETATFADDNGVMVKSRTMMSMSMELPTVMDKKDGKKMDYFCKFWNSKKEVAKGFLIPMIRPLQDSYFYCIGAKVCHPKGDKEIMKDPELLVMGDSLHNMESISDIDSMKEELDNMDFDHEKEDSEMEKKHHHHHDHHEHHGVIAEFFGSIKHLILGEDHEEEHDMDKKGKGKGKGDDDDDKKGKGKGKGDDDDDDDKKGKGKGKGKKGHVCVKCYKKVFGIVMKVAVMRTKKMCNTTKCPFLQGWCKWAGEHKEMAFGMLMGKVEPWKYAIGRCYHKEKKGEGKGKLIEEKKELVSKMLRGQSKLAALMNSNNQEEQLEVAKFV